MIKMTNEAYTRLAEYKQHFIRAVKGGYTMGINASIAATLHAEYKRLGGNKRITMTCSNCIYAMVKELGQAWLDYTPKVEEEQKEDATQPTEEVNEETPHPTEEVNEETPQPPKEPKNKEKKLKKKWLK